MAKWWTIEYSTGWGPARIWRRFKSKRAATKLRDRLEAAGRNSPRVVRERRRA